MYLQDSLPPSLSHFVCHTFKVLFLRLWIMESQTLMIDNAAISKNERLVQIRKKIMDVFDFKSFAHQQIPRIVIEEEHVGS
jgi:hypothetical protein